MIYFDNAATSRIKPKSVIDAFLSYVLDVGTSPGRGSYDLGVQASRMLYQARKSIAEFFGCPNKTNVVFTKNSTEAINLFFNGYLGKGDHVLISPFEHNAVLRPLHTLSVNNIIEYSVISELALTDMNEFKKFIRPNTKLVAITLASNLTGQIIYSKAIGELCSEEKIPVFVDASQGAGKKLVNMESDKINFLAFTGHKDLLGLTGVGGLCTLSEFEFPPLIQGGTGIHGEDYSNPRIFPDSYESGTINMPAIWALKTAVDYISNNYKNISETENALVEYLLSGLKKIPKVSIVRPDVNRVPTVAFNISGRTSSDVVSILNKNGICVRGGIHCAILAHETLGTVSTGAVRVSLNYNNTINEIDKLLSILQEV